MFIILTEVKRRERRGEREKRPDKRKVERGRKGENKRKRKERVKWKKRGKRRRKKKAMENAEEGEVNIQEGSRRPTCPPAGSPEGGSCPLSRLRPSPPTPPLASGTALKSHRERLVLGKQWLPGEGLVGQQLPRAREGRSRPKSRRAGHARSTCSVLCLGGCFLLHCHPLGALLSSSQ